MVFLLRANRLCRGARKSKPWLEKTTWLTAQQIGPAAVSNLVQMFRDEQIALSELLHRTLDIAIEVAGADKGTLQRLDAENGCAKIVASRGFSDEVSVIFRDS